MDFFIRGYLTQTLTHLWRVNRSDRGFSSRYGHIPVLLPWIVVTGTRLTDNKSTDLLTTQSNHLKHSQHLSLHNKIDQYGIVDCLGQKNGNGLDYSSLEYTKVELEDKNIREAPNRPICLLTSNSYCLQDCICLTLISNWLIIGGGGRALPSKNIGRGGTTPPPPPPPGPLFLLLRQICALS